MTNFLKERAWWTTRLRTSWPSKPGQTRRGSLAREGLFRLWNGCVRCLGASPCSLALRGGAPVSPGREAKAEALAVLRHMGMPCGVCDPPRLEPKNMYANAACEQYRTPATPTVCSEGPRCQNGTRGRGCLNKFGFRGRQPPNVSRRDGPRPHHRGQM
jgi:hypothetical protein